MGGRRRWPARARPAARAAGEGAVRVHSSPSPERDRGRGAPLRRFRGADGHLDGALGNGARADRRPSDRRDDVGRGRYRRAHASNSGPRAQRQDPARDGCRDGGDQVCGRVVYAVSQVDGTHDRLIATYRKKAKHYDLTSRLYPVPGYPQRGQRIRAVRALGLRRGDTVVDIACGTGLNFSLLEAAIGPEGRIVGVDLTDAMLDRAGDRIEANGWSNGSLRQGDPGGFDFP